MKPKQNGFKTVSVSVSFPLCRQFYTRHAEHDNRSRRSNRTEILYRTTQPNLRATNVNKNQQQRDTNICIACMRYVHLSTRNSTKSPTHNNGHQQRLLHYAACLRSITRPVKNTTPPSVQDTKLTTESCTNGAITLPSYEYIRNTRD